MTEHFELRVDVIGAGAGGRAHEGNAASRVQIGGLQFTRAEEIGDYAAERGMSFAGAVVALVNRGLSLPDPEPTLDERLHELQGQIQAATDRAGWTDPSTSLGGQEVAGAVVDLGRCVTALVSVMRRELRSGIE